MSLRIGELASQGGVGVETVRFYERKGLLEEPPRRPSGHRAYPEAEVARLLFIRRAKGLGFSLAETRELLSLRAERSARCGEVKRRTQEKIADIELKIRTLQRMRRVLKGVHTECDGDETPIAECPILEAFEEQGR